MPNGTKTDSTVFTKSAAGDLTGKASADPTFLFNRNGILFLLGLLVGGAWYGHMPLTLLSAIMLSLVVTTRLWSRLALARVVYIRRLETNRAFPGEAVELAITLENRKILPLTWLETTEEIPGRLAPEEYQASPEPAPGRLLLKHTSPLLWYQRRIRRHQLICRRRGYYSLGPAALTSGDIFGLFPRRKIHARIDHLIVYPQVYDLGEPALPSRFPIGEAKAASRLFEDPTRTIGLRQYTRDVPFKNIHWKASARHQEIQVKVFEPTTTLEIILFLDVDGFESDEDFEFGVSLTASLAKHGVEAGHPVGCFVNAAPADAPGGFIRIGSGSSVEHLMYILELLAKIDNVPTYSFDDFFQDPQAGLTWGATLCPVTARLTDRRLALFEALQRSGFQVLAYQIGSDPAPETSIACQGIRGPQDLQPSIDSGEPR